MGFRFVASLSLIVAIALFSSYLELRALRLRRGLVQQQFQLEELRERQVQLRVAAERSGTPERLIEAIESGKLTLGSGAEPTRR